MSTRLEEHLHGTPYSLESEAAAALENSLKRLDSRVVDLRSQGTLTETTLREYYGAKRFEQVAESNAIEGSTLNAGETELAILKGTTLTGHDPAYVRDAVALDKALNRLVDLAKEQSPTDIKQLTELHGLVLAEREGAGMFRQEPVRIRGSDHRPPKTREEVLDAVSGWEAWSADNADAPAVLRSVMLHAWLSHIHPFVDGNGRTARAISNLELVRAGYPPVIIRRKERERYIDALAESDEAGNIGPFFELMLERVDGALTGLELSAKKHQGYDREAIRVRRAQERNLEIWNTGIQLLHRVLVDRLEEQLERVGGTLKDRFYTDSLDFDDYIQLCSGRPISRSWCFWIEIGAPGLPSVKRLAWVGYRSDALRHVAGDPRQYGPALFWSAPNIVRYPPWISADNLSPGVLEATSRIGNGDEWYARRLDGTTVELRTTQLAELMADGFMALLTGEAE